VLGSVGNDVTLRTASASIASYLQYACGHGAMVTLPRIKGESPRVREQRVALEKVSASQRPCDFCGPARAVATPLLAPAPPEGEPSAADLPVEGEYMTMATSTEQPSASTASMPTGQSGRSPLRKLSDEQELELTRLYSQTETPVPEIASRFNVGESSVYRISQRHGAKLRSRGADARPRRTTAAKPAAAAATPASTASITRAGAASGTTSPRAPRGRPRRAAATTAASAAAPSASTRRRRGAGAGATSAATTSEAATQGRRRAASTTARRGATGTRGRRGARGAQAASSSGSERRFRVVFQTELVVQASTIQDAIRQAEARGARDISSVTAAI
jgi:transposase-like protein